MPVLIAVLLGVAGFIWWSWGRDRAGAAVSNRLDRLFRRRPCKWSTDSKRTGLQEYRCSTCGVTAYSQTGRPPVDCKRSLKGGL